MAAAWGPGGPGLAGELGPPRREDHWARKPHGSVYWAEIPGVFTGFWAGGLGMSLPRVVLQSSFPCQCDGCGSRVSSLRLVCMFRVNGII